MSINRSLGAIFPFLGVFLGLSSAAYATNLMDVYRVALKADPTFQKAEADWLSARMNLPLARTGNGTAGSGLFPNLSASTFIEENYQRVSATGESAKNNAASRGYQLTVTQPIFNWATWQSISEAGYVVKAATATYLAAAQNLMQRVAFAYLEVLRANDQLQLTLAAEAQYLNQLVISEAKYKVGVIPITGVYDAQASYDAAVSQEISARVTLQNNLENLRAITGVYYPTLAGLTPQISLKAPEPAHIEEWVALSNIHNYNIQAALNTMLAAKKKINVAAAGWYPYVNMQAGYGSATALQLVTSTDSNTNVLTTSGSVGVSLNFPVFRGGYDQVNTKQTRYNYLSASDALEFQYLAVNNATRQSFWGVSAGIIQIKANAQSILAARNQLEATEAGYLVGTRTMLDVLNTVTDLTTSQLSYANSRYNYLEYVIALEQNAGTLSPRNLEWLNGFLGKPIVFQTKQPTHWPHLNFDEGLRINGKVVNLLEVNTPNLTSPQRLMQGNEFKEAHATIGDMVSARKGELEIPPVSEAVVQEVQGHLGKPVKSAADLKPPVPKKSTSTPKVASTATVAPHASSSAADDLLHPTNGLPTTGYAIELFSDVSRSVVEGFWDWVSETYPEWRSQLRLSTSGVSQGHPAFHVYYGQYATLALAEQALHALPEPIQEYQPKVVSFETLAKTNP